MTTPPDPGPSSADPIVSRLLALEAEITALRRLAQSLRTTAPSLRAPRRQYSLWLWVHPWSPAEPVAVWVRQSALPRPQTIQLSSGFTPPSPVPRLSPRFTPAEIPALEQWSRDCGLLCYWSRFTAPVVDPEGTPVTPETLAAHLLGPRGIMRQPAVYPRQLPGYTQLTPLVRVSRRLDPTSNFGKMYANAGLAVRG